MPVIRNRLSEALAGGPRQFTELRDKFILRLEDNAETRDVLSELRVFDLQAESLNNLPIVVAEPQERVEDALETLMDIQDVDVQDGVDEIRDARERGEELIEATSATISATRTLLRNLRQIGGVSIVDFVTTSADYGPENLRQSPADLPTLPIEQLSQEAGTLGALNNKLNLREAWTETRGENAIVAVFDTGFAPDLISQERIVDTFHGESVDSVFASSEGHGTMCAGAATANKDEGVPFNGAAPDAGVILVRITDDQGQIRGDIISKAWDWITGLNLDRPMVLNHSYGTPLCSGRPRQRFCDSPEAEVVRLANSDSDITSFFAAGNEANRCGHRPSGITNAITGTNSLAEVITVGALRFDGRDAQTYSSHGRGDCAPIADPKPNVSCALPNKTYYGGVDGWKMKDMSTGIGGSSGGTSHATPTVCGMAALLQSKAMDVRGEPLQTEQLKRLLESTADPPRPTQINSFGLLLSKEGYDARFGFGQVNIVEALDQIGEM